MRAAGARAVADDSTAPVGEFACLFNLELAMLGGTRVKGGVLLGSRGGRWAEQPPTTEVVEEGGLVLGFRVVEYRGGSMASGYRRGGGR